MDPVTHTLVGAGLSQAFFRREGRGGVAALALASNLPDIDAVVLLTKSPVALTLRRSFGHSLVSMPGLCLMLALALKILSPQRTLRLLFGLCLLGAGVHVALDLLTSSGVLLLWPLSSWRPELDLLFVMDPVLLLIAAAPFLLTLPSWEGLERACRLALAAAAAYVLLCGASRLAASARLSSEASAFQAEASYLFPEPYGAHRWQGVLRKGNRYRAYLIDNLSRTIELKKELQSDTDHPSVARARQRPAVRWIEPFFTAPVWTGAPGEARLYDLKFRPLSTDEGLLFEWSFPVAPDGSVGHASWAAVRR